jgi:hypothetical protein
MLRTERDKKRVTELKRRARKLVGFKHNVNGYAEKVVQDEFLTIKMDGGGDISVKYNGSMVYFLREDGYAPLVRLTHIDDVLYRLRQLLVLEDLADIPPG